MKFRKFVGNSYLHIFTNFCRFILIFHQMARTWSKSHNFQLPCQTVDVEHC